MLVSDIMQARIGDTELDEPNTRGCGLGFRLLRSNR